MDCDEIETEATKTIGSTDIEKVLKNLKNKNTKESIILLDYINRLEEIIKTYNKNYINKDAIREILILKFGKSFIDKSDIGKLLKE